MKPLVRLPSVLVLATALLAGPFLRETQGGPTITLIYKGNLGGVPATAVLSFEDTRTPISGNSGFFNIAGHWAWVRFNPLSGRIYVSGYIISPAAYYNLSDGNINGTANWGYLTIDDPYDGQPSFPGELDLPYDASFIYLDQFWLTPNPLQPPQTTYNFSLDMMATPTISPNGGSFSGSVQVTLACATAGAAIYFTTNGTVPTASSPIYSAPFTLANSATVKATAAKTNSTDSFTASASFTVTPNRPSLTVTRSGNNIIVSWPSPSTGFGLQQNTNVTNPNGWINYSTAPSDNGTTKSVTLNSPAGNLFFRLKY